MNGFWHTVLSNQAFLFLTFLGAIGFITEEKPLRVAAICLLLWAGLGIGTLKNAIDDNNEKINALAAKGQIALIAKSVAYGPFANRLLLG